MLRQSATGDRGILIPDRAGLLHLIQNRRPTRTNTISTAPSSDTDAIHVTDGSAGSIAREIRVGRRSIPVART